MVKKMEFGKLISQMDKLNKTNFKMNSWRRKAQFTIQQEKFYWIRHGKNNSTKDLKNYSINEKQWKQPK
jgi:hypothetical protein